MLHYSCSQLTYDLLLLFWSDVRVCVCVCIIVCSLTGSFPFCGARPHQAKTLESPGRWVLIVAFV